MKKPRQINEDEMLNDPALLKIREQLSRSARNRLNEVESEIIEREDEESIEEDDEFTAPAFKSSQSAPRGAISNAEKLKRIRDTEQRLKSKGLDSDSLIRRDFDVNEETPKQKMANDTVRQIISNRKQLRTAAGADQISENPEITVVQRLERKLEEQEDKIRRLEENKGIIDPERKHSRLASRRKEYHPDYFTVSPPSKGVAYDFGADVLIKKVDVTTQVAITTARRNKDYSAYIDALGSTLKDIDIRDFSTRDWWYILYWHKFNSYPRSSLILRWKSKYGNNNTYKIQAETQLGFVYPAITRQEFLDKYDSNGLCMPTLRDWELLNTPNDFTEEDREIYAYAQYFKGDTIEEKVDNYFSTGQDLDKLELITELNSDTIHGVKETVDVVDEKFDAREFVNSRKAHLEFLEGDAQRFKDNLVVFNTINAEIEELQEEINTLEEILDKGGQVRPEVETQPVRFNALDIFPFLQY